jgi:hypothetical protein
MCDTNERRFVAKKKRRRITMLDYSIDRTYYRKTCSIKDCGKRATWAFTKNGRNYGACSRKHLRRIP